MNEITIDEPTILDLDAYDKEHFEILEYINAGLPLPLDDDIEVIKMGIKVVYKHSPAIHVHLQNSKDKTSKEFIRADKVLAIIDTGATHTHISKRLLELTNLPLGEMRPVEDINLSHQINKQHYKGVLMLPNFDNMLIELEVGELTQIRPQYEIVLGLDFLNFFQFTIIERDKTCWLTLLS